MGWGEGRTRRNTGAWSVLGIPIYIDASWFVILALMTWSLARGYFPETYSGLSALLSWTMGVGAAVLLFACVLLHELGHSLVARRFGIPVARVTLFIFGGVAHIQHDPRHPSVELAVALAGPLVSALIAGGCFAAARALAPHPAAPFVAMAMLRYLAMINLGLIVFNLLPGFPLDGGRILRAALWAWTGDLRRATRMASVVGMGLGFGLLALGLWAIVRGEWLGGLWYACLGLFLRNAATSSYHAASLRAVREEERR